MDKVLNPSGRAKLTLLLCFAIAIFEGFDLQSMGVAAPRMRAEFMLDNAQMAWDQNEDYLYAKLDQCNHRDTEGGREEGLKQFLDEKSIKPGLQSYKRTG